MNNLSGALVWRGVLALVVGVIAVAWPGITIGAFVILFAVYAFAAAGGRAILAFRVDGFGASASALLLSALDVAAGIGALLWPGITALGLVWLVSIWAFISGFAEVAVAFTSGEKAGERALLALGGLISLALGTVFVIRPDIGIITISQVYGLFSIVAGVSQIVMATNLTGSRATRQTATA